VLDNIKALQFINRNISGFGGNAGNVTVMGQSAGAIDVYALLTSPLMVNANPKLMHRAVPLAAASRSRRTFPPEASRR
jgi:para-nitrobenzyl esterase